MSDIKSSEIHHYRDGQVVLYKRERSRRWQGRFKTKSGTWQRISTGEVDLIKAAAKAVEIFDDSRFRIKYELPEVSRRFDRVARQAVTAMKAELDAGMGKVVFKTYIAVIELHLIPYFGTKYLDKIKPDDYSQFYEHQQAKFSKKLSRSTITNYNSALSRIFDIAVTSGWLKQSQIPTLKNSGAASDRRPAFTLEEYRTMTKKLITWSKGGTSDRTKMIRRLLRDYVLILANTGMRPGTESDYLKWKHIEWHTAKNAEKYLRLHVNGKTKQRELIARHNCVEYFKRIQSRFPELAKLDFDDLLKAKLDVYVFRLENGERTRLNQNFEQFLAENNMLKDHITGQNRTLYSLRHTYATFALTQDHTEIYDLAVQMGTSVEMIEKHYSHLTPTMRAKALAGEKFQKHKASPATEKIKD